MSKEQGEQSTSNLRNRQNDTHWGYKDHPQKHLQRQRHHQKTRTRLRKESKSLSAISQAKTHCTAITDGNELKREMVDWKVRQSISQNQGWRYTTETIEKKEGRTKIHAAVLSVPGGLSKKIIAGHSVR